MNSQMSRPEMDAGDDVLTSLADHLHSKFRGRIESLRVLQKEGRLVLQGRTRTYYVKQLVQHATMAFTHIPIEANAILVESAQA